MKLKPYISISPTGFVFNATTGDTFKVNQIGIEILEFLKQDRTEDQIKQFILTKYDIDDLTLDRDLTDFISALRFHQLIE